MSHDPHVMRTVIEDCYVACCDSAGTEYRRGYVVIEGGRVVAVGGGSPTLDPPNSPSLDSPGSPTLDSPTRGSLSSLSSETEIQTETIDGRGCLLTPGLINTHHHLYQWTTRGVSQDETLFGWLTTLYPIWAGIDEQIVHDSAAAGLGWLALTGCTTSSDHHYVFPERGGDLMEAEISAARTIGLRFHPARGSMDLGQSQGGLPPDSVVEDRDAILAATESAIDRYNDPSEESMLRIVVGPCSPFSVTGELMREAAQLARRKGVRLHTHLAETHDEDDFCRERFNCTPAQYADQLGWLGDDVWMAHCIHLSDEAIDRFAQTGTGVAHCPTSNARIAAGMAPLNALLAAGVPVGLGVDGPASNESGRMVDELHQALLIARLRDGPLALSAREALQTATIGGARCLGRQNELGSIEPGKLADLALWRVDGLAGDGIEDPVCALVFGASTLDRLLVGGRSIVAEGRLLTADQDSLGRAARAAAGQLRERALAV